MAWIDDLAPVGAGDAHRAGEVLQNDAAARGEGEGAVDALGLALLAPRRRRQRQQRHQADRGPDDVSTHIDPHRKLLVTSCPE